MDMRLRLYRLLSWRQLMASGRSVDIPSQSSSLAEQLGYNHGERLLIVHADDLGVAHSANVAFFKSLKTGLVNSGSVMVPCPWFPEIAAFAREHPEADLGIHLTLASEEIGYRWGPVAPRTKVTSLIDRQGYFHPTGRHDIHINLREVENEIQAQIEKAYQAGLRPTHLDSHQYCLQMSGRRLFEICLHIGRKYELPIFVVRDWFAQFPYLQQSLTLRDVVIDHTVTIDANIAPGQWTTFYRHAVENLRPGVTQFVIHPGLESQELQAIAGDNIPWGAAWRQRDFDFFTSEEFRNLLANHNVKMITWRDILTRLRERLGSQR